MKNKTFHKAWLILLGLLLIQGGVVGIFANTLGVLMSAIRTDLGFRAGDLSIFYLIRNIVGGLAVGTVSRLFFADGSRKAKHVLVFIGCCMGASVALMSLFHHLWQWYAAAVLAGVGASSTTVIIPVILRNWFQKRTGFAIGLAMAASGIFGAVFSPVSSALITSLGWRTAAVIIGITGALMIILPGLFLVIVDPGQVGLEPYGVSELKETGRQIPSESRELPPYVFIFCAVAILASSSIVQFTNQMPVFAQTAGYTLSFGALLTSFTMAGNLSGKLLLGTMTDRFGFYRSAEIFLIGIAAALAVMLLGQNIPAALCTAVVIYGFGYSIAATGPGLLFPDIYGSDGYQDKLKKYSAISMYTTAALSVVFPYIYDFTGSFDTVFIYGIAVCLAAFFLFRHLRRYSLSSGK